MTLTPDTSDSSGVRVIDRTSLLLGALAAGPATVTGLAASTGLTRTTVHRLLAALERLRMVGRDTQGRGFVLGPRLGELAGRVGHDGLLAAADPVLTRLRDLTGGSARLYQRLGDVRVCIGAVEGPVGLPDAVPVGATLPMKAGPVAQVLLAWEEPDRMHQGLHGARFDAVALSGVRRRGWAQTVAGREPWMAAVAAPVRGHGNRVVAAVAVAGSVRHLSRDPGRRFGSVLIDAGHQLGAALQRPATT